MDLEPQFSVSGIADIGRQGDPGCCHHGCVEGGPESVLTLASAISLLRTAACLALVLASVDTGRVALLFLGLAVHCAGDMADGFVARRWSRETRTGAVLDIVCDRLCIAVYYVSYGHLHHEMLAPIGLFLFSFMVLDSQLSLAFLNWPLLSLNYFSLVDRTLYRWNWSPLGKGLNSGALVALMLVTRSPAACLVFASAICAVKVGSLVRLYRAGVPMPAGCAAVAS